VTFQELEDEIRQRSTSRPTHRIGGINDGAQYCDRINMGLKSNSTVRESNHTI